MADKEQQEKATPEEKEDFGFWDNDPRTVPEHYVESAQVHTYPANVTLLLGNTYWEGRDPVDFCKLRLILSHYEFVKFAEEVQKHATFLKKIYKGNVPGPTATEEEFDIALEEVFGND